MPRGGKRLGAGSKPKWKHGKTKTIRVPVELADQVLEFAHKLDQGQALISQPEMSIIDYDTESMTIDLSGVSLVSISGQIGVKLTDLLLKGYEIKPTRLADVVRRSLLKT